MEEGWLNRHMTGFPGNLAVAARQIAALLERAIAEERQACATLAETFGGDVAHEIADRIRSRGDRDLTDRQGLGAIVHGSLEASGGNTRPG